MALSEESLDLIVLGATGFTGMNCIPYIYKLAKENGRNLSWGISGRSEEKLKQVLSTMGNKIGVDLTNIPIILTDIKSDESLQQLARKTKILIDCCGPFKFLGEPVVKACIETGTHYVDISGETEFIELMQLKYDEAAKEKGVYIVSSCGLDSIPCDLGLIYLQDKFEGTLNSVVTYTEIWEDDEETPGPLWNYGTWESTVHHLRHGASELAKIRKKLFSELPSLEPKLKPSIFPHRPRVINGWSASFDGPDKPVMDRTQKYLYTYHNQRPVQVDTEVVVKSFFGILKLAGLFRKDQQPSEEKMSKTLFQVTLYGKGWKNKNGEYTQNPDRSIVAVVKGKNPAYGTSCAFVVGSAIMIATEKDKMPHSGGVYTPGIAFGKTSLIELLIENGITFKIVSQKSI